MKFQLKLAALALVMLGSTGCTVWQVPEFGRTPFNAESGDIVNVVMDPNTVNDLHPWDRCMNMGGAGMRHETTVVAVGTAPIPGTSEARGEDIILEAVVSVLICEGVDF